MDPFRTKHGKDMTPSVEKTRTEAETAAPPDWVFSLVRAMDDSLRIPGTRISLGLDALLGFLLPGAGDAFGVASQLVLLYFAFRARVPGVVMARMVLNALLDALLGAVPLLGDVFDIGFKANRKNLQLLERAAGSGPSRARPSDYVVLVLAVGAVTLVPLAMLGVTITLLAKFFTG